MLPSVLNSLSYGEKMFMFYAIVHENEMMEEQSKRRPKTLGNRDNTTTKPKPPRKINKTYVNKSNKGKVNLQAIRSIAGGNNHG